MYVEDCLKKGFDHYRFGYLQDSMIALLWILSTFCVPVLSLVALVAFLQYRFTHRLALLI